MAAAEGSEVQTRAQALAELKKSDPAERRRGALGLAAVGRMGDAPALVAALRDEDELVRAIAEEGVWALWSRSGDERVDDLFRQGVTQMGGERLTEAIATFTRI